MGDRPILFSAPMVRAILDGRKTQTRRPVKVPESWEHWYPEDHWLVDETGTTIPGVMERYHLGPFGAPGDRLWVREAFRLRADQDHKRPTDDWWKDSAWYEADPGGHSPTGCAGGPGKLRPSIHMPRWASRITLNVLSVRVERLHEITEADAKAEGFKAMTKDGSLFKWGIPDRDGWPGRDDDGWSWHDWCRDPRDAFKHLWRSIYGTGTERGDHGWDANPLVWVCTFKREVARG